MSSTVPRGPPGIAGAAHRAAERDGEAVDAPTARAAGTIQTNTHRYRRRIALPMIASVLEPPGNLAEVRTSVEATGIPPARPIGCQVCLPPAHGAGNGVRPHRTACPFEPLHSPPTSRWTNAGLGPGDGRVKGAHVGQAKWGARSIVGRDDGCRKAGRKRRESGLPSDGSDVDRGDPDRRPYRVGNPVATSVVAPGSMVPRSAARVSWIDRRTRAEDPQ